MDSGIYHKIFDDSPLPTVVYQLQNDVFRIIKFNKAIFKYSSDNAESFMGAPIEQAYDHRPDIVANIKMAHAENKIIKQDTKYYIKAVDEERPMRLIYVPIGSDLVILYISDLRENEILKMRIAKTIYDILSVSEKDILYYMSAGMSRREMAKAKNVTRQSIDTWINRIKDKAGGDLVMMVDYEKYFRTTQI